MSYYNNEVPFETLVGKTVKEIYRNEETTDDELIFETAEGERFKMYHDRECCEHVRIEDVCGDLKDLLDTPILQAEETSSSADIVDEEGYGDGSTTWTFYKLATIKGSVTIRWLGESNGYYSESVSFEKL